MHENPNAFFEKFPEDLVRSNRKLLEMIKNMFGLSNESITLEDFFDKVCAKMSEWLAKDIPYDYGLVEQFIEICQKELDPNEKLDEKSDNSSETTVWCDNIYKSLEENQKKMDLNYEKVMQIANEAIEKSIHRNDNIVPKELPKIKKGKSVPIKIIESTKELFDKEIEISKRFAMDLKDNIQKDKSLDREINTRLRKNTIKLEIPDQDTKSQDEWIFQYQQSRDYPEEFIDQKKFKENANVINEKIENIKQIVNLKSTRISNLEIINHIDDYIFTRIFSVDKEQDYLNMLSYAINLYHIHESLIINNEISLVQLLNEINYYTNVNLNIYNYINENKLVDKDLHSKNNVIYKIVHELDDIIPESLKDHYTFKDNG